MKRPCKCLFLWSLGGAREPSLVTSSFILQNMKKNRIRLLQLYIYIGNVKDASSSKWRIDQEASHRIVSYLTVGFNSCCTAALRGQARPGSGTALSQAYRFERRGTKSLVTHDFLLPWACLPLIVVYCTRRSIIIVINVNRESMSFSTQRGPARLLVC